MSAQLFLNNFDSQFIAAVKAAPVTGTPASELDYGVVRLSQAAGATLGTLTNGDYYILTAFKRSGSNESSIEVMKVTNVDTSVINETRLTVLRGQEGTTPESYVTGDYVSLRWTAASASGLVQKSQNLSDLPDAEDARTNLGLGNVSNTSDANKPVSTAQQTALDAKAPLASPTFTGNVSVPNINGASPSGLANKIENGCMRITSSAGASGSVGLGETLYGAEGIRTLIGGWATFSGGVYQLVGAQDARTSSGAMHYVAFGATTGASGYVLYTYRIKAQEALTLAGKPLTLSCRLATETTPASNHSFRVYKANAYDDFSGETFVATSGNLGAVSGILDAGAQFTLSYTDCFNGISVQVLINYPSAPVAPAYLSIADFSCRSGSRVVPFEPRPLELEKALVNRFKPTAPINLTANTTLASNAKYSYSAGALTLTLPAAPVNGDEVVIYNTGSLLTTIVGRNGKTIMGLAQDMTLDIANKKYVFEYLSATGDWRIGA